MNKVIVTYEDREEVFDNVTSVKCFLAFDMFENTIEIMQGDKRTTLLQYEIVAIEIK